MAVRVFLSTLSLRRATPRRCLRLSFFPHFYPRSPCGERLPRYRNRDRAQSISIHALLAESDGICACMCIIWHTFLSTLSLRRATYSWRGLPCSPEHFYPRSPCGERPKALFNPIQYISISIHALLAESDLGDRTVHQVNQQFLSTLSLRRATHPKNVACGDWHISIHALLAESD